MRQTLFALAVFGSLVAAGAWADTTPPPPAPSSPPSATPAGACKQDIQTFCPDTKPGEARRACFKEHFKELSPGCKEAIKARRDHAHGDAPPPPPNSPPPQ